jgi:SulP family sulfate permease
MFCCGKECNSGAGDVVAPMAYTADDAIFASQIRELLGLSLEGEPGELLHKREALWAVRHTITPQAVAVSFGTMAVILLVRRFRPHWPGMLIAVALASVAAWALGLPPST